MDLSAEAIQQIRDLCATKHGGVLSVPGGNVPVAVLPEGYTATALPSVIYNEYADNPHKLEASRVMYSAPSFTAYFNRFATAESIILADPKNFTLSAILDYHSKELIPEWCRHRAKLEMRTSAQLTAWLSNDGKLMGQSEFAEFLQENAGDLERPSASEMLTIARDLRATVGMSAVSNFNQQTGEVEFSYKNEVSASAGVKTQKIEIPERFELRLPLFANDAPSYVVAQFRYRAGQEMKLMYKLYQVQRLLEERFSGIVGEIQGAITTAELPILIGA